MLLSASLYALYAQLRCGDVQDFFVHKDCCENPSSTIITDAQCEKHIPSSYTITEIPGPNSDWVPSYMYTVDSFWSHTSQFPAQKRNFGSNEDKVYQGLIVYANDRADAYPGDPDMLAKRFVQDEYEYYRKYYNPGWIVLKLGWPQRGGPVQNYYAHSRVPTVIGFNGNNQFENNTYTRHASKWPTGTWEMYREHILAIIRDPKWQIDERMVAFLYQNPTSVGYEVFNPAFDMLYYACDIFFAVVALGGASDVANLKSHGYHPFKSVRLDKCDTSLLYISGTRAYTSDQSKNAEGTTTEGRGFMTAAEQLYDYVEEWYNQSGVATIPQAIETVLPTHKRMISVNPLVTETSRYLLVEDTEVTDISWTGPNGNGIVTYMLVDNLYQQCNMRYGGYVGRCSSEYTRSIAQWLVANPRFKDVITLAGLREEHSVSKFNSEDLSLAEIHELRDAQYDASGRGYYHTPGLFPVTTELATLDLHVKMEDASGFHNSLPPLNLASSELVASHINEDFKREYVYKFGVGISAYFPQMSYMLKMIQAEGVVTSAILTNRVGPYLNLNLNTKLLPIGFSENPENAPARDVSIEVLDGSTFSTLFAQYKQTQAVSSNVVRPECDNATWVDHAGKTCADYATLRDGAGYTDCRLLPTAWGQYTERQALDVFHECPHTCGLFSDWKGELSSRVPGYTDYAFAGVFPTIDNMYGGAYSAQNIITNLLGPSHGYTDPTDTSSFACRLFDGGLWGPGPDRFLSWTITSYASYGAHCGHLNKCPVQDSKKTLVDACYVDVPDEGINGEGYKGCEVLMCIIENNDGDWTNLVNIKQAWEGTNQYRRRYHWQRFAVSRIKAIYNSLSDERQSNYGTCVNAPTSRRLQEAHRARPHVFAKDEHVYDAEHAIAMELPLELVEWSI